MKKKMKFWKLFLLSTVCSILLGCEKSYPTYYDLNGEYIIDQVIVIWEDQMTKQNGVYAHLNGRFSIIDPITPVDSFTVGLTRFKITDSNRTFMWNKVLNNWMYSTKCSLQSDMLSGEWDNLLIYFSLNETNVTRTFKISQVGVDDFMGELHQNINNIDYQISYHFEEVGP